jgi:hypothetical protein
MILKSDRQSMIQQAATWRFDMRKLIGLLLLLPMVFTSMPSMAVAADSAISSMAEITMHLNHYPNDSEKKALDAIINDEDATAGEKVLARALMNMQHKVGGSDAGKLTDLKNSAEAGKQEKVLADVLLGLTHKPSADDKKRLQFLVD